MRIPKLRMEKESVTYAFLRNLIDEYEKIDEDIRRKIYHAWKRGEAIDLPISKIEVFLIKEKEINKMLKNAIKKLQDSFYEGVFAIRTLRREAYGTGKSQFARFLFYKLMEHGFKVHYEILDPDELDELKKTLSNFVKSLNPEVPGAVIIDEVDLLAKAMVSEEEQISLIEKFANILISVSQKARNMSLPLMIILVLSAKIDRLINRVSRDRLGRRLSDTLIDADIILDLEDIKLLSAKIFALLWSLNIGGIKDRIGPKYLSLFLNLAEQMINDVAFKLFDAERIRNETIGSVITELIKFIENVFENISEENWLINCKKILGNDRTYLGKNVERVLKDYISLDLARFSYDIDNVKIEIEYYDKPLDIQGRKTDGYYVFKVGDNEIGYVPVEITLAENISEKKQQLITFANKYPTLIFIGIKENAESILAKLSEIDNETTYGIIKKTFNEDIIRYSLLLKKEGRLILVRNTLKAKEDIDGIFRKLARNFYDAWIPAPLISEKEKRALLPVSTVSEIIKVTIDKKRIPLSEVSERLRKALRGELGKMGMDTKTRKQIDKIEEAIGTKINSVLRSFGLRELEYEEIKKLIEDVIDLWSKNNLGEKTPKTFKPYNAKNRRNNPTWSNEKAVEIILKEALPRIIDKNKDKLDTSTLLP